MARHVALTLAYVGTGYAGWQRQRPGLRTVQGCVEDALSDLDGRRLTVRGAGRTDAGVHAAAQVADFWLEGRLPAERLPLALIRRLPPDIVATAACEVLPDFHARFSAISKVYRYLIWTARVAPPFLRPYTWWHPGLPAELPPLEPLLGRHDFRAFAGAARSRGDTVRDVLACRLWRRGPLVGVEIEASGFLYRMMRSIVGSLAAGRELGTVLDRGDRRLAGPTAPPQGLCLLRVRYPQEAGVSVPELDVPGGVSLE